MVEYVPFTISLFQQQKGIIYDNLPQGFLRETDCEVARAKNIFL